MTSLVFVGDPFIVPSPPKYGRIRRLVRDVSWRLFGTRVSTLDYGAAVTFGSEYCPMRIRIAILRLAYR